MNEQSCDELHISLSDSTEECIEKEGFYCKYAMNDMASIDSDDNHEEITKSITNKLLYEKIPSTNTIIKDEEDEFIMIEPTLDINAF